MRVAIVMGSTSDLPKVEPAITILKEYGVEVDVRCLSAHRAHKGLSDFIAETNNNGTEDNNGMNDTGDNGSDMELDTDVRDDTDSIINDTDRDADDILDNNDNKKNK